ncbi:hypothetical protein [Nocardioides cynanchi]|uniref:hypothetical protein n=1 Tax=Nocardioides cynanchi TaxID=2558918 RepID=UPI001245988C|nr:hypothetical protein [Nocardioides cynanchi]
MSTDDDFTAYVGTHWSMLVRTALLLGCATERAEDVVTDALVGTYQRWARVWQDDRADLDVLTRLLGLIHGSSGRPWRGDVGILDEPPAADDEVPDDASSLVRALLPLDPRHRDALVLRYVAELDELSVAEVLDVRPELALQRTREALTALHPPLSEQQLVELVEQHRADQLMSLPPPHLLASAHDVRRGRRRRTLAATAGVLAAVLLISGAVHVVRALVTDTPAAAAPGPAPPWAQHPSGPATRLVGLNGWAIQVPGSWGTDRVACDGVTPSRPTVLFTALLTRGHRCRTGPPTLFVRIGNASFTGVPWRTVSGVPVRQRRHHSAISTTLRVPSARVSFHIRAANRTQLRLIRNSLQPVSSRQITVPIGTAARGRAALGQMVTIATGAGLRPRMLEVPSREQPGTFLFSVPPIGTPVDLGRSISLFFSAGDLGRFAATSSLRRHGWRIFPVAVPRPTYGRPAAVRAALGPHRTTSTAGHPTFLRILTITHDGPRRVVVRRRLVWLVVTPDRIGTRRGAASITAVDAVTDRVIETQHDVRGRIHPAIR